MPTEFIAKLKPSGQGGDYTTASAAEAGLQCDLTSAATKVFSISAASNPTIAAADAVTGQTSSATGTCILVNAAGTQILIASISGTFQSGEVVQKTSDASRTVTLSNAGDSAINVIEADGTWSSADTTAVTIDGSTTNSTNYIEVRTASGARHDGKWNTGKYRIEAVNAITISDQYVRIAGVQIKVTDASSSARHGLIISTIASGGSAIWVNHCLFYGNVSGNTSTSDCSGIRVNDADAYCVFWNNIFWDWLHNSDTKGVAVDQVAATGVTERNDTAHKCYIGFRRGGGGGTRSCTNCGASASVSAGFSGTITQTTCSSEGPTFVDSTTPPYDLHLASNDTTWTNVGTDLSAYFTTDIDGQTRPTGANTWDIGADEYVSGGGQSLTTELTNSMTLGDAISNSMALAKSLSDGITMLDSREFAMAMVLGLSDGMVMSESKVAALQMSTGLADGITMGDLQSPSLGLTVALANPMSMGEALDSIILFTVELSNAMIMFDSLAVKADMAKVISNAISIAENLVTAASFHHSIANAMSMSDGLSAAKAMLAALSNAILMGDAVTAELAGVELQRLLISLTDGTGKATGTLRATTGYGTLNALSSHS